ncbi:allophanate hydrolase [Williamsia serinedens]|uniref:Allophanate hydrolase n=1 Tax=Williamsia serinedens TaxID=391736 RepID=A0ABT1H739_9NOCA|nr:allophanate hydrolase [Williamsia serinedens]MCP2161692.1 allophanate hydrolase [Williamsia serinedens]
MTGVLSRSVVDELFDRLDALDRPEIFLHLRSRDEVRRDHEASIAAGGPLAGMILAVKNNVDVAGFPTTAACPGYGSVVATDAPVVAALRSAGAVVLGTTNLDQFATGLVGTRSPHGAVRDSRRAEFISGGSSSGSAVAVALGLADIAIGTDTAGSGRVPAALQGIVGIKPTVGAVSTEGVVPACASYDCVTVFARDLATADAAMAELARAAGSRPFPADIRLAAPPVPTIAVPAELTAMDEPWCAAFAAAVDRCRGLGWHVTEVPFDDFLAAATLLYDGALVAERFDAVGEFVTTADESAGLDPTVAGIIGAAGDIRAVDLLADRRRVEELRARAMGSVADCDAIMVPTAPFHPSVEDVAADPVGVNARMGTYTNFCNLFDLCGIAIPAGEIDDGSAGVAQFGVTFLAPAHHDAVVVDLARRFRDEPTAAPSWPEAVADVVDLAVFGAHLRGQPLEHELATRGARWSGELRTSPDYRLVELATTPPKPGLVAEQVNGRSIRGERWTLSTAALGSFLAALPAPMGLGAITLDDGSSIVGFACAHDAAEKGRPLDVDHWLDR